MTRPLRLALSGASGRMGRALLDLLGEDAGVELVHAVVSPGSVHDGEPVPGAAAGSLRYAHDWTQAPPIDVVVDFSSPAALGPVLDHCLAQGTALVSGTTGLDAVLEARLDDAARRIAILRAANFSLGVAVLTRLLREAAAALPGWDLEIVEAHHGRKQDAPSGTALALGRAAAATRGTTLEAAAVYSREGRTGRRNEGSIGFAVVRGGDIVGEHTAMLIGQGERLELAHRATDRMIFARGALHAAHWLAGRAAGSWQLEDVIATPR
ncbi:4-hydroxy-tetrahydrodipicolinate reductase [Rhodanobacter thiooxydans]|uniref:4-hydroxy-tetrahydrodipicolinate reductase n=1 Tax=Rhodanobacter thiooxydans TaxID=416169 RepID=A0A154QEA3_9GAMM|nr:4-hydroxy-tetrahydrodipicolinate reductase [Rhodanobacter thiooxydans]KZC22601.1 4-hydroxy-tetrahydrodipicolinate reductase [Rhodanobacter thiooxydans]MCW0202712.1 4-hydroxy-tetrahydrodipicolinate reductase [Rhodanobacter thiooxydans]